MSVTIATRVFASEVLVGLIRYYGQNPGSQTEAAAALDLTTQLVSSNTRLLIDAGVVVEQEKGSGRRGGKYAVDKQRVRELADALLRYSLGE